MSVIGVSKDAENIIRCSPKKKQQKAKKNHNWRIDLMFAILHKRQTIKEMLLLCAKHKTENED